MPRNENPIDSWWLFYLHYRRWIENRVRQLLALFDLSHDVAAWTMKLAQRGRFVRTADIRAFLGECLLD
jgi:hypothetical protein